MSTRVLFCAACGAPLDAPWHDLVVVCGFCGAQNLPSRPDGLVPLRVPADGRPRVNVGGRTYVLEGRLALGDSATVYRGRWVVRLGELVVLKVLTAMSDGDLLRREWDALTTLVRSTEQGSAHFTGRLPQPVAHGLVDGDRARPASVFAWKSGFQVTLTGVGEALPDGVPGQALVWLLKRLLELLGFVHRSGWVHGAVTPDHVLVHPRDHGATLVGWTVATPWSSGRSVRLPAVPGRWEALYDGAREATPALDIAMACRCVRQVAGWHLPSAVRADPVDAVVRRGMGGREDDAWALAEALSAASREVYGPPAYHPLTVW